jgi:hypothetical protein
MLLGWNRMSAGRPRTRHCSDLGLSRQSGLGLVRFLQSQEFVTVDDYRRPARRLGAGELQETDVQAETRAASHPGCRRCDVGSDLASGLDWSRLSRPTGGS